MATDATLDDIALGDIDPAKARAVLSKIFAGDDSRAAQRTYTALRAWVWKALDGRRRDPELREWFDVLKRAAAFLKGRDAAMAERIVALHELVHESIAVSERLPVEETLRRRHVRDVLAMLDAAPGGRLGRAEVGRRLGLKQGNLTRVLNMVTDAGLAERAAHGKQAEFQLTRAGQEAAGRLRSAKPAPAVSPPRPRAFDGNFIAMDAPDALAEITVLGVVERQGMNVIGLCEAWLGRPCRPEGRAQKPAQQAVAGGAGLGQDHGPRPPGEPSDHWGADPQGPEHMGGRPP